MIYNDYDYEKVCNSCAVYITLFIIAFLIIIGISSTYRLYKIISHSRNE